MAIDRVMAVVGAGHVGGRAAQALREYGWQGGIALIGSSIPPTNSHARPASKCSVASS